LPGPAVVQGAQEESLVRHKEHEEAEEGQSLHKKAKQQLQTDVTNVLEIQGSA